MTHFTKMTTYVIKMFGRATSDFGRKKRINRKHYDFHMTSNQDLSVKLPKSKVSPMDIIFIDNLKVYGILGIHPREQKEPQLIRISAKVFVDISYAAEDDDIDQTVNYSELARKILDIVYSSHFFTIEALIETLAKEILSNNRITKVWLRVEKPTVVPEADSVGVEITRASIV